MNLHCYQTHFTHDSRILKQTHSLAGMGFFNKILIGAIWKYGLPTMQNLDDHRTVFRLPLWSARLPDGFFCKVIKSLEWELRLYLKFRKEKIRVFNAHSLIVLPLGVVFKVLKGCKLVYDTHELATETQIGPLQRSVYKLLERLFISYSDIIVTVSKSISDWYRSEYNLEQVFVIKNVPYKASKEAINSRVLRDYCQIGDENVLFIYQGILEEGRGIDLILECFSETDQIKHIVFMGMGALEGKIKEFGRKYANIHFHAAVPSTSIAYYTASADVGISLIENTCLNYYYCLPNKIFEYFSSGIPAIVSDFPEMSRVIQEEKVGWAIPVEKEALLNLINNLSRQEIEEKKKHALQYRTKFCWQDEETKLIQMYQKLLALP